MIHLSVQWCVQLESANLVNYNLHQVELWAKQWLVKFNPTKTKLMNIKLKKLQF